MSRVRRTQRAAWVFAILLVAAAGLFFAIRSPQPSYGGKDLTEWLHRLEVKGEEDQEAVSAVRQIGTNAIPALLKMMRCEDSAMKRWFIAVLQSQRWVKFRIVDESQRHVRAELGFSVLGPIARSAVAGLEALTWKPKIARFAVGALVEIGEEGLRAAIPALSSTNVIVRREISGRIGALGIKRFMTNSTPDQLLRLRAQGEIAVPPLIMACTDPDELVRARATISLGLLGQKPELAVPVLIKLLREESGWRVPGAAAKSLGRFGTNAISAIPALKETLGNNDSRVSGAVKDALRAIESASELNSE